MNPGCTITAHLLAKPDKREELLGILRSFIDPTRAEAGCVEYHLHVSDSDPNLFIFYENWRSRADLDEHLALPLLSNFIARAADLLARDVDIQFMTMLSAYDK